MSSSSQSPFVLLILAGFPQKTAKLATVRTSTEHVKDPETIESPISHRIVTLLAKMLSRTVYATRAAAASTGKREFSALFTAVDEFPG